MIKIVTQNALLGCALCFCNLLKNLKIYSFFHILISVEGEELYFAL